MNELRIFENEEFGLVRTVVIDGDLWFVGSDAARALGYTNPNDAVSNHCKHGKMEWGSDSLGRRQKLKIIPRGTYTD